MARGMVNGEPINSQAQTKAFDEGWEGIKHEDDGRKGRFVHRPGHPKANALGFVHVDDLGDWQEAGKTDALTAPVMCDRYLEGLQATDGTDIGSRRKRREYMRANELCDADDFKGVWAKERERRLKVRAGDFDHHERREQLGRTLYELRSKRR